jgi:hypothetical protein
MRLRAHVRFVAAVWLTCQAVAFAAAPFVLCHDHNVMSQTGSGHECDPSHHHHSEPAQTSTAHEHHQHTSEVPPAKSDDAALNCRCTLSDAALAALTLEAGVLPGEFVAETTPVTTPVVLFDRAVPTRVQQIDTPPPRA